MRNSLILLLLMAPFVMMACNGNDDSPADTNPVDADVTLDNETHEVETDTQPEMLDEELEPVDPCAGGQLCISDLVVTENPNNLLSAYVTFETNVAATARILVEGPGGKTWTIGPTSELASEHEMAVLGMYAESDYSFTVSVTAADDSTATSEPRAFETAALPADFPTIEVVVADSEQMEPGYTLFNVNRWTGTPDILWGLALAVDETGQVVWYHKDNNLINDIKQMSNGNIYYTLMYHSLVQVDLMGNRLTQWRTRDLELDTIHHDVIELPSGNLLVLGTELREIDGYELEDGSTTSYSVVGDLIIELSDAGEVVQTWSLFDYLDPLRVREGFELPFWDLVYALQGRASSTKDWTHANGIIYDESDDTVIVSICHQNWVIKIDLSTGELVWKLGEDGDFELAEGGEWQFHQHAPRLKANGNIMVYDNGMGRSSYGEDDVPYTRAVEFAIDTSNPEAMTATQVWEYRNEEDYYAPWVGFVDPLDNGNVLLTDGMIVSDPFLPADDSNNSRRARIIELIPGEESQKVFEITLTDEWDNYDYVVYRATRIPNLIQE